MTENHFYLVSATLLQYFAKLFVILEDTLIAVEVEEVDADADLELVVEE